MRCLADVAPAAFWDAAAGVLASLVARVEEGDFVERGCCAVPSLIQLLGEHSLNCDYAGNRWEVLDASGARIAEEMWRSWLAMCAELRDPTTGPLALRLCRFLWEKVAVFAHLPAGKSLA